MKRYLDDCFFVVESVKADLVIGNPPWMTWDALRREYSSTSTSKALSEGKFRSRKAATA
jgi:hypothetical protein